MHDGSIASLREVIAFYNTGGFANPGLDPLIHPLRLNSEEITDLVSFLESLTGGNINELAHETDAAAQ